MNYDQTKQYLLNKPETFEDFPFGPDVSVFKVKNKMFATLSAEFSATNKVASMNLKCDPDQALALRDIFESVIPGYHMNKKHWNTLFLDGSIPVGEIERMIDHSFGLVVKGLNKTQHKALELQYSAAELYGPSKAGKD